MIIKSHQTNTARSDSTMLPVQCSPSQPNPSLYDLIRCGRRERVWRLLYSKNVNKLVCKTFMALVASLASMTQLMLISLAPVPSRNQHVDLSGASRVGEGDDENVPWDIISIFTL
jgi:hypothetical protein